MASSSGTLRLQIVGDATKLNRSLNRASSKVADFGRSVAKIGTFAAVGAGALGGVGFAAAKLGSQLEDVDKKARTVFEDQIGDVRKWARENAKSMGLTQTELVGLTANFADLLKPMGFTAEQAADMSKDTNSLAGALSEWSNGQVDAAGASEILAKAMLGEREGLKTLGISIMEADVQQRLLEKGQKDLTGTALQQAKAIATQELIFEKSTDAQTAFAEGSGTTTRKMAELRATLLEARDTVVKALMPTLGKITDWLAEMLPGAIEKARELFDIWGPRVVEVFEKVRTVAVEVFDKIASAIAWVRQNQEWLLPIAAGVLSAFMAFKAIVGVVAAITKAKGLWAAAQAILNTVLAANPIGIVVIAIAGLAAALVTAYQTSETFRDIVNGAFRTVKSVVTRVWGATWDVFTNVAATAINAAIGMIENFLQQFRNALQWARNVADAIPGVSVGDIPNVDLPRLTVKQPALTADQLAAARSATSGAGITVNVAGSVTTERDLVEAVNAGLAEKLRSDPRLR